MDQKEELDALHRVIEALKDEANLKDRANNNLFKKIEDTTKFDYLEKTKKRSGKYKPGVGLGTLLLKKYADLKILFSFIY